MLYVSFHEVMWIGHCSYQLFPLHHLENMHAARDNEKPEQARYKQRALRACGHVTGDRALYRFDSLHHTTPPSWPAPSRSSPFHAYSQPSACYIQTKPRYQIHHSH